ncbi:MAG: phosphoglycerate kinase [Alphaproteobacteria bacterium]
MQPYPTLADVNVENRAVLMRVDFNIPPTATGGLVDDYRLHVHLPAIQTLLKRKARLVLLTHRGRPQGQVVPNLSTLPLAEHLSKLLGTPVGFVPDCVGRVAEQAVAKLGAGEVLLLENTRFHLGEQINDPRFVKQLASLGEVFVNDAFAVAHRPHASVSGLAATMAESVLGPRMLMELEWLNRLTQTPARPLVCMLGGAQVPHKLEVIRHLMTKVDTLILGGVVAHTFLASRDMGLGHSMVDPDCVNEAREIFTEAGVLGCRLLLPLDFTVTQRHGFATPETRPATVLRDTDMAMDIGPQTLATWSKVIQQAGSLIWLGSMGAVEHKAFQEGTLGLANAVLHSQAFSVVGGDGLQKVLREGDLRRHLPHVASGAAALMHALQGKPLPPLQVL